MSPDLGLGDADPRAYMQVAARVRRQIADGTLTGAGPSITVVRQETGYSRLTISKGFRVLEREGLLARLPGVGYYVTEGDLAMQEGKECPGGRPEAADGT